MQKLHILVGAFNPANVVHRFPYDKVGCINDNALLSMIMSETVTFVMDINDSDLDKVYRHIARLLWKQESPLVALGAWSKSMISIGDPNQPNFGCSAYLMLDLTSREANPDHLFCEN